MNIESDSRILDIGSGTGRFGSYINIQTDAKVVGIDYSTTAIDIANRQKRDGLSFQKMEMDQISFPENSFDGIYAVDTIFLSSDIPLLIEQLVSLLRPNGIVAIFHIEILFDPSSDPDNLLPAYTLVGSVLEGLKIKYEYYDFTDSTYEQMIRKRIVAKQMKKEFLKEGNEYLYDYMYRESIDEEMSLAEFKNSFARYLYIFKKQ